MIKIDLNPILVALGPIRVTWYGMMYVLGFILSYLLVRSQVQKRDFGISLKEVEGLYFDLFLGLIIGARIGYVLFYDLQAYLSNLLEIFAVWHGGMSFHGGLIGVLIAAVLFCRKQKKSFWKLSDLFVVTAPLGLALGRIGNFINGELYGRVTQVPWAMIFPKGGPLPRHPSQLYESALEGGLLFLILWRVKDKKHADGYLLALFIFLYGAFRFFIEFFREPDVQLGFVLGPLSMGQILCTVMIAVGIFLMIYLKRRSKPGGSRSR